MTNSPVYRKAHAYWIESLIGDLEEGTDKTLKPAWMITPPALIGGKVVVQMVTSIVGNLQFPQYFNGTKVFLRHLGVVGADYTYRSFRDNIYWFSSAWCI